MGASGVPAFADRQWLRRRAATIMAELGINGDVIDERLNHKIESRLRRTYVRDR